MQNIPLFTTENGVASLTLQEIPYTGKAYIRIQSSCAPEILLSQCVDFCKAAGAEQIYATGHDYLTAYPLHTTILQMQRPKAGLPETDVCLFPVQEMTLEQWRGIYNDRMQDVSNSAFMTLAEAKKVLQQGKGYFVHRDGELLGIGIATGNKVEVVISLVSGAGKEVFTALSGTLFSEEILVEVASDNAKAIHLYEKLGFVKTKEIATWYKIFENVK